VALVLFARVSLHFLNRTNGAVVSSGETRPYLLYVPKSYDAARPTPLVISLHALALWPAAQAAISHWNQVADEHGFISGLPVGDHAGPFVQPLAHDAGSGSERRRPVHLGPDRQAGGDLQH
jgi:poly(3-hydroxybutyrate) depolymerase